MWPQWLASFGGVVLLLVSLGAGSTAAGTSSVSEDRSPVRGVVRPVNQASIAIDIPIRVVKVHVREAEAFKQGQTLVSFDCTRLIAEHAAAEAVHLEMRLGLESQTYLDQRGAVGKLDVEISRARVHKARAESEALAARLKQCAIVAPYDGRVTDLKINEHEIAPNGQPLISIVDESSFEIDMIVPSTWLRALIKGQTFLFTVDETGETYDAKVLRVGAAVDPVSQTVRVIAGFLNADGKVLAGMSGNAKIVGFGSER